MMRLVLIGSLLIGCGSLSHTVDRELLADITIENKMMLFDAENDVSIAVDEKEQIQRDIRETKQDIQDAEAQITEANSDQKRAEQKNDAKAVELAELSREVFHCKVDYLEAHLDYLRERLHAQEGLVRVSLAKYELAKAKLVKRNNVRGAQDVELADFEMQVDAAVENAKETQTELSAVEKEVLTLRDVWKKEREALAQKSGGGAGSPWAEESASWGASF